MKFFDLNPQYERLGAEIERRTTAVRQHKQFVNGPEVKELEQKLADYIGVKHVITCANGTDALELSLEALGLKPGDEVITTAYSYFATAEAIERCGLKPVFVDIDPKTYNIDPAKIEEKITEKTKAIIPVSLFGQCADFDAINALAKKHSIPVIEDGAQSLGATYKGHKSLSLSTMGCTSFFPTKPLGGEGDGGACFTNDDKLATRLRMLRNHGQGEGKPNIHVAIGRNSRLDSMQAAVLLAKLPTLHQDLADRRRIAERYSAAFKEIPLIISPPIKEGNESVYAQYLIQVPHRDAVKAALERKGIPTEAEGEEPIPTAVYYKRTIPMQPVMRNRHGHAATDFPEAEKASGSMLALPMYPGMSEHDQDKIISAVKSTVERAHTLNGRAGSTTASTQVSP